MYVIGYPRYFMLPSFEGMVMKMIAYGHQQMRNVRVITPITIVIFRSRLKDICILKYFQCFTYLV